MQVIEPLIPQYLEYIFPEESEEKLCSLVDTWIVQVHTGSRTLSDHFVNLTSGGNINAAVHVAHLFESTYGIMIPPRVIKDDSVKDADIQKLIKEAVNYLSELGAKHVQLRLTKKMHLLPIAKNLPLLGFTKSHCRIEFQAQVSELPRDNGTPFKWVAISEQGHFNLKYAAKFLELAGDGDKNWGLEENNLKILQSYLNDEEFKSKPDCPSTPLFWTQLLNLIFD